MIAVDRAGPVWTLTLTRPDKANALTRDMLLRLDAALAEAEQAQVAALILTGAGRVFSAGADLDEAAVGLASDPLWEQVSGRIAALPCLTVAALNGTLAGGAFGMALACDLRVAVPGASFFYPVMRLGYLPQPSDPARLAVLIGPSRARMILMAGVRIDADTALAWGLIDRIVPPDALVASALTLTEAAQSATPDLRRAIKRMIP